MAGPLDTPQPASALSFGGVADAYDRARPTYPAEAASWLVGHPAPSGVVLLELGAGTGKLTAELVRQGHQVVATDPLDAMLRHLVRHLPSTPTAVATAEQIPLASRSVDAVVGAQCFHWWDVGRALSEIARVLRPGGHLALAWNLRDERVPWVRRLGELIGTQEQQNDPTHALLSSHLFGFVETATFRFWQPLDRTRLRDLVLSRSNIATCSQPERERVLRHVDALYDDYGRGADGMLLPYVTHCYKAVVRAPSVDSDEQGERPGRHDGRNDGRNDGRKDGRHEGPDDGGDTDALLIDFH